MYLLVYELYLTVIVDIHFLNQDQNSKVKCFSLSYTHPVVPSISAYFCIILGTILTLFPDKSLNNECSYIYTPNIV